jgi:hypothetical protein
MRGKTPCVAVVLVGVLYGACVGVCGARDGDEASAFAVSRTQAVKPGEIPRGLTSSDWGGIRGRLRETEYQYSWHDPSDGYVALNRGHGLETVLDTGGLRVSPAFGQRGAGWGWEMRLAGWGVAGEMRAVGAEPAMRSESSRVELDWSEGLTEWYVNDQRGVEQGFTIASRHGSDGGTGALVLEMTVETGLHAVVAEDGKSVVFSDAEERPVLRYGKLVVTDALGRVLPSRMELSASDAFPFVPYDLRLPDHDLSPSRLAPHASRHLVRIVIDDAGATYPLTVDPLLTAEVAKLTASDGAAVDQFGNSVSVSGDTVVVGADWDDVGVNTNQGSAYVFVRSGSTWTQQAKLTASDGAANDYFGYSVSVSGDTVVVGAYWDAVDANVNQGSAYVFVRTGTTWSQQAKLTASDGAANDYFGYSVSVSGDAVVVGAYWDAVGANVNQGSAYVFVRTGTTWSQQAKLTASDGAAGDQFGISVSVSGDTVVVGANFDKVAANNQGSAYVYCIQRSRGDFNGDGKSDVLWRRTSTGQVVIWPMNGCTMGNSGSPALVSDSHWQIKGVGDTDGDGKADILWHYDTTGSVHIWRMNGTSIVQPQTIATVPLEWRIDGVGDFNGDGKSDILWRNTSTGQVSVWHMNGFAFTGCSAPTVSDLTWQIQDP